MPSKKKRWKKKTFKLFVKNSFAWWKLRTVFQNLAQNKSIWWVPQFKKKKKKIRKQKTVALLGLWFGAYYCHWAWVEPKHHFFFFWEKNRNTISNYTKRRRAILRREKESLDFRERERGNEENGIWPLLGSKPLAFKLAFISPNGTPPQTQMGNLIKLLIHNMDWENGITFFLFSISTIRII